MRHNARQSDNNDSFTFLFLVVLLHGDMDQFERNKVINAFKKQEIPILVATDVAGKLMNQGVHQKRIMLIFLMLVVASAVDVFCELFRQFHRSDLFCGFYVIFLSFILLMRVCGELWVFPVLFSVLTASLIVHLKFQLCASVPTKEWNY